MAQQQDVDQLENTFRRGSTPMDPAPMNLPSVLPANQGDTAINIFGGVITAQRVAVKRNIEDIRRTLFALAARAGSEYYYSIPFRKKDKQTGEVKTEYVEGPTIVLANDLAREWGNCSLETRVVDGGANWMFYSRFTDLQTGYQLTRGFQQRKAQDTGMKDEARRLDMVFQIGQSKSQRNVVVNALQSLANEVFDEAKKGLRERIAKEPEKARAWIVKRMSDLAISQKRVEEIYGRSAPNWTVTDMAQMYAELKSIEEGVAVVADVYPPKDVEDGLAETPPAAATGSAEQKQAAAAAAKPPLASFASKKRQVVDDHLKVLYDTESPVVVGTEITFQNKVYQITEVTDEKIHAKFLHDAPPPQAPGAPPPAAAAPKKAGAKKAQAPQTPPPTTPPGEDPLFKE